MRIILLILLSMGAYSQQYTFKKATYYFFVPGTALGTWWRTINQNFTITIDTANKTITLPNFQMWETLSSKRNLINGVTQSQSADTALSTILPNVVYKLVTPFYNKLQAIDATFYTLENKVFAAMVNKEFFLEYPVWNNWIRSIELTNE